MPYRDDWGVARIKLENAEFALAIAQDAVTDAERVVALAKDHMVNVAVPPCRTLIYKTYNHRDELRLTSKLVFREDAIKTLIGIMMLGGYTPSIVNGSLRFTTIHNRISQYRFEVVDAEQEKS